jgi:GTP-binding protein LepA
MLTTFYDQIKIRSRGYASLDYELIGLHEAKLVKLDVLVNEVPVDAFSRIIMPEKAHEVGKAMVAKLKEAIPRQLFKVPIQAAIGSRVVARVDISAKRKDVLAKCYGGDITRKRKLLEKQKEGKKKMKSIGRVEVPKEAFLDVLKIG